MRLAVRFLRDNTGAGEAHLVANGQNPGTMARIGLSRKPNTAARNQQRAKRASQNSL
jgi:hypothetical protein